MTLRLSLASSTKKKKKRFAQRKIVSYPQMISLILFSYSIAAVIGNQKNLEKGHLRAETAPKAIQNPPNQT